MPEHTHQPSANPNAPPAYNAYPPQSQGQHHPGQFGSVPYNQGQPLQRYPQQQGYQRVNQPGNTGYVNRGSPDRGYRGRRGSGGSGIGNFATGMLVGGALGGGMRGTLLNKFRLKIIHSI